MGLATKKAGKGYMQVTLGAANAPPTYELAIADEVVILSPLDEKPASMLTSSFASPDCLPSSGEAAASASAPASSVTEEYGGKQLTTIESRLEAKFVKFQDTVEDQQVSCGVKEPGW